MLCVFYKDGFEDNFWWIIWESITFIAALHDGQSVANKQHYRSRLLLRNSEDIYKSAKHRKYNKATFRHTININAYKIIYLVYRNLKCTLEVKLSNF